MMQFGRNPGIPISAIPAPFFFAMRLNPGINSGDKPQRGNENQDSKTVEIWVRYLKNAHLFRAMNSEGESTKSCGCLPNGP